MAQAAATVILRVIGRLILLGAFGALVFMGADKAQRIESFARDIASHAIVPLSLARHAAAMVAGAEIVIGSVALAVALGARAWLRAVTLPALLLLGFAAYATILAVDPPPVPAKCGCIRDATPIASWWQVGARNGCFAAGLIAMGVLVDMRRDRVSVPPDAPAQG